jgi:hypothetical protein
MGNEFPSENVFEVSLGEQAVLVIRSELDNGTGRVTHGFRVCANRMYLQGCCWHFALVGHRLTGLDIVQVVSPRGKPLHVALSLPDGSFFDSRGILETERDLHRAIGDGTTRNPVLTTRACPIQWLESVVKPERDDPELRLFLAETEAWFRLLASMVDDRLTLKEEPRHGLA